MSGYEKSKGQVVWNIVSTVLILATTIIILCLIGDIGGKKAKLQDVQDKLAQAEPIAKMVSENVFSQNNGELPELQKFKEALLNSLELGDYEDSFKSYVQKWRKTKEYLGVFPNGGGYENDVFDSNYKGVTYLEAMYFLDSSYAENIRLQNELEKEKNNNQK